MAEARDYERGDISVRATLLAVAIGSLVLAIIGGVLWLLTQELAERAERPSAASAPALMPEPRYPPLQHNPQADLRQLEAQASARLDNSGWVDHQRRLAHIPIDRAMDMLAEQGWPAGAP